VSVRVRLDDLDTERNRRGGPVYLLTVRDGAPRACSVEVSDQWHCPVGAGTRSSLVPGSNVALLWGNVDDEGFSLIVDAAVVAIDETGATLDPKSAVLHQTRR
jgi:hypothetical protein